jgi:hypothetical protein
MCAHQVRSYGPSVNTDDGTHETSTGAPAADHDHVPHYAIRVKGHLGSRWSASFDGLSLTHEDDGTTVIHGPVVDQAALHGVLQKLRDVGIPLVSLTQVPLDAPTAPRAPTAHHALRTHEGN